MLKRRATLILSALVFSLSLSACATPTVKPPVAPIEVRTIQIPQFAPIVPNVDQLDLKSVVWIVITPENADDEFAKLKSGEVVFFALTADGYKNLSMNIADIRANIEQYKKILAIYKKQFKQ